MNFFKENQRSLQGVIATIGVRIYKYKARRVCSVDDKDLGGENMSFLEEYKRLDNLCKDMFSTSTGITTYIEELEKIK